MIKMNNITANVHNIYICTHVYGDIADVFRDNAIVNYIFKQGPEIFVTLPGFHSSLSETEIISRLIKIDSNSSVTYIFNASDTGNGNSRLSESSADSDSIYI